MEEPTWKINFAHSPHMSFAVEKNIFWFAISVDNPLFMKMSEAQDNLTSVEPASFFREAWLPSHIINVKF